MKNRLLSWWADIRSGDLNPILVRELRQYTRGRFSSYIVVLMLVGLVLVTASFFANDGRRAGRSGIDLSSGKGAPMFAAVVTVLVAASLLLALQTAQRAGSERQKEQPDLLYSTSLSPGAIVRGKLFAGLAMFGLLFSLALPFMTMTYLLRGIDARTILWGFGGLAVLNILLQTGAILFGCTLRGSRARRNGTLSVLTFLGLWLLGGVGPMFLFRGGGRWFLAYGLGMDRAVVLTLVAVLVTLFVIPYALSVLVLSPKWSNRARPFRLAVTGIWAMWCSLALIAHRAHGSLGMEVVGGLLVLITLVLLLALQVGECAMERPSNRVLRTVPRSLAFRVVCFPFYAGQANSLVWCLGLLGGLFAVACYVLDPSTRWSEYGIGPIAVMVVHAINYVLTAGLVSRVLPEKAREGAASPWLLSLYLFAAAGLIPAMMEALYQAGKIAWRPDIYVGCVFPLLARENRSLWNEYLVVAVPWLVLVLGLNGPRVLAALGRFRRLSESSPSAGTAAEAVEP